MFVSPCGLATIPFEGGLTNRPEKQWNITSIMTILPTPQKVGRP